MGPWRIAPPDNASLLHLFRPQHAVWTLRSTPLLRLSSRGWRRLALSGGAIRHGHPPCIWCRNQTVLGAPVGIFGVSTMLRFQTSTPFQTFEILRITWPAPTCSPPSTL